MCCVCELPCKLAWMIKHVPRWRTPGLACTPLQSRPTAWQTTVMISLPSGGLSRSQFTALISNASTSGLMPRTSSRQRYRSPTDQEGLRSKHSLLRVAPSPVLTMSPPSLPAFSLG